jgi:hypothetical protein
MAFSISNVKYRITIRLIKVYFLNYRFEWLDLLKKEAIKTLSYAAHMILFKKALN